MPRADAVMSGRFAEGAREALVEFHRLGRQVKVSALDPVSLTEVSIIAPAGLGERQMTDNVLRKLDYVLSRAAAR
ncbi:MAG: DUF6898 family protein [Alphaproteobacteria bacterium]